MSGRTVNKKERIVFIRSSNGLIQAKLIRKGKKRTKVELDGTINVVNTTEVIFDKSRHDLLDIDRPNSNQISAHWVVVQLSPQGELEYRQEIIKQEVFRYVGQCEIFIPWVEPKSGYDNIVVLLDGYIFIRDMGLDFTKLSNSSLFLGPISKKIQARKYEWTKMSNNEILNMKRKLQQMVSKKFERDSYVLVEDGPYKRMTGRVVELGANWVEVEFVLNSMVFREKLDRHVLTEL